MIQTRYNRPCFERSRVITGSILLITLFLLAACDSAVNTQEHPVLNQGKSLLYISTSTQSNPDTLTMLRSGDGKQLWQYRIHGDLATGLETPGVAVRQGLALQVVNGIIYFAVAAPSNLDTTSYTIMALRADNGLVVWQKHVKTGLFEPLVIAGGEICVLEGPNAHVIVPSALTLDAYNMKTGTLDWQRKWSDTADPENLPQYAAFMDGSFYFLAITAYTQQHSLALSAIQASTGKRLWKYEPALRTPPVFLSLPVASVSGIVTIYSLAGSVFKATGGGQARLVGLRESDGTQVWSHAVDPLPGVLPVSLPLENGILYFATINTATSAITAHAIRINDGAFLWQQSITQQASYLLDLTMADGRFYVHTAAVAGQGRSVGFPSSSVTVLQARDGKPLWHFQINQQGMSQLAVSGSSSVYLQKNRTLYVLRPSDGVLLNQYQLPTDMPSLPTLLMASGKLSFTYLFSSSPDKTRTFVLQQDGGKMAWNHEFDMYLYSVVLGP